jgi:hypothetical protein
VAPTIEKASLVDKAKQSVIRPPLTVVSCPVPNRRSPPSAPRFSSRSPRLRPKPRAASSSPSPLSASPPPVRTPPTQIESPRPKPCSYRRISKALLAHTFPRRMALTSDPPNHPVR